MIFLGNKAYSTFVGKLNYGLQLIWICWCHTIRLFESEMQKDLSFLLWPRKANYKIDIRWTNLTGPYWITQYTLSNENAWRIMIVVNGYKVPGNFFLYNRFLLLICWTLICWFKVLGKVLPKTWFRSLNRRVQNELIDHVSSMVFVMTRIFSSILMYSLTFTPLLKTKKV